MLRHCAAACVLVALLTGESRAQCPDGSPPPCPGAAPAPTVAVLDFENRSRDTTDAILAEGLADEIAAQLGGVERLTVRSRTVVRRLRGAGSMSVPQLGRALSSAYLVSGSIQRAGPQLRVHVELLRTATGAQAWAQRYDQASTDLFQTQSDIATAVSQAIAGRLLPRERAGLSRRPTHSNDAYQLYVRAVALRSRGESSSAVLDLLQQAATLDTTFAEAWALLSRTRMLRYFTGVDRSTTNLAAGRAAAERARRLAPEDPETHLALGYVAYWGSRDYAGAQEQFGASLRLRPGDADTWEAMGLISRRQGRIEDAAEQFRRASTIDPSNLEYLQSLRDAYLRLRRLDDAARTLDSSEAHGMPAVDAADARCLIAALRGDWTAARTACHRSLELAGTDFTRADIPLALFVDPEAGAMFDRMPRPDSTLLTDWYVLLGLRFLVAGDTARSVAYADSAVGRLGAALARDTTDTDIRANLADALSTAGHHEDALREIDRAIREMPASRDALVAATYHETRVSVLARARSDEEALDEIERVTRGVGIFKGPILERLPELAPLRNNPRFQRLVALP